MSNLKPSLKVAPTILALLHERTQTHTHTTDCTIRLLIIFSNTADTVKETDMMHYSKPNSALANLIQK